MHYCVWVLTKDADDIEGEVARLLAPYNSETNYRSDMDTETDMERYQAVCKWDWYQIGGRWTGMLSRDYDPETDPQNVEVCFLCGGTGKRPDMEVQNGCNGCEGKGQRVAWPTQWVKFAGDVMRLSDYEGEELPYAIVTPDGVWHEHQPTRWAVGEGGYEEPVWPKSEDERAERDREWRRRAVELVAEHRAECVVAVVDCHN